MTPDPTPAASEAVLLPCPWCGEQPVFLGDDSYGSCYLSCHNDECAAQPLVQAPKDMPELADQRWNARTRPPAAPADLAALKNRIDTRLNNHLCDMKEGWDDSVSGFNDAWGIVRAVFAEAALAASAAGAELRAFEVGAEVMRRPRASNADDWQLWLLDHKDSEAGFVAVQIVEAIEEHQRALARYVYALAEATQDECHDKDEAYHRGRYHEAKGIARAVNAIMPLSRDPTSLPLPPRATTTEAEVLK